MREAAHIRRDVIAHYVEHGTREAYAAEKTSEAVKAKSAGDGHVPTPAWGGAATSDFFTYRQGGGQA